MNGRARPTPFPLRRIAQRHPRRVALRDGGRSLTYGELEASVVRAGARLRRLGVRVGDAIGLLGSNSIPMAVAIHALRRIGAVSVPLNLRHGPAGWSRCLRIAGSRMVLADAERLADADRLDAEAFPIDAGEGPGGEAGEGPPGPIPPGRPATILFTSGSTGRPRGVPLTLDNFRASAAASLANIPLSPGDRWLAVLPLCHAGGMAILFRTLFAGCAALLAGSFDPASVNRGIDDGSITHISLVPTMLEALLAERGRRAFPGSLRTILLGGAPVPVRLIEPIARGRIPALLTYGMTEAASQVATQSPHDPPWARATAGRPLSHVELRIAGPDDRSVASGVPGEIRIRGPSLFTGYLGPDPGDPFDGGGWFRTGDEGSLDADGRLHLHGRLDDTIVSGGEKILPGEIEAVAGTFPGVAECAVIGVEDERWGERPLLLVRTGGDAWTGREALRAHLAARLPSMLVPERIVEVDRFPRTTIGKIDRRRLRAAHRDGPASGGPTGG